MRCTEWSARVPYSRIFRRSRWDGAGYVIEKVRYRVPNSASPERSVNLVVAWFGSSSLFTGQRAGSGLVVFDVSWAQCGSSGEVSMSMLGIVPQPFQVNKLVLSFLVRSSLPF